MRVPRRAAPHTVLISAALLVAACGGSTPAPPASSSGNPPAPSASSSASPSSAPSEPPAAGLLLEVTSQGGFINPVASLGSLPAVVVDTDGELFLPAEDTSGNQPLIPAVEVRALGPGGAAAIEQAIRAAGLDQEHPPVGVVADAGATVFTVDLGGVETVNRFAAGGGPGGPGVPGLPGGAGGSNAPSGDPTTAAAFALLARLTDPTSAWGSSSAAPAGYQPAAYRVYAAPAVAAPDAGSPASAPAWPLATPLDAFGVPAVSGLGVDGLRSGIVRGADAASLASALGPLAAGTQVASAGRLWQLWVRPLVPGEVAG